MNPKIKSTSKDSPLASKTLSPKTKVSNTLSLPLHLNFSFDLFFSLKNCPFEKSPGVIEGKDRDFY